MQHSSRKRAREELTAEEIESALSEKRSKRSLRLAFSSVISSAVTFDSFRADIFYPLSLSHAGSGQLQC